MPRIRVAVGGCELELVGTAEFIDSHSVAIAMMLERVENASSDIVETTTPGPPSLPGASNAAAISDMEFGQALLLLPDSASGTDQILLAGQFAQSQSDDSTFSTRDASQMLMEQGIKLANPSQSIRNNSDQKRVFKVGKRFRVSADGQRYVEGLLSREPVDL